jgi:hypothetical protein
MDFLSGRTADTGQEEAGTGKQFLHQRAKSDVKWRLV